MGTGDFIVPSFEFLIGSEHKIAGLFTMPVRSRRKDRVPPPAVRRLAREAGIAIYDPENINSTENVALLQSLGADLIFICDYGKILSPSVIASVRFGGVNLHGSLLPKYRGAAPVARAILAGEKTLGVSVIHIVPAVDAGPILLTDSYQPEATALLPEIEEHLARLGAPLVLEGIRLIGENKTQPIHQTDREASAAPKIKKGEGQIDWTRTAQEIFNQYRAFQPWPKTFSDWHRTNAEPLRLILGPLKPEKTFAADLPPGTIVRADEQGLLVCCGEGAVQILGVQPAGKRALSAEEFLRGYRLKTGDRFQ